MTRRCHSSNFRTCEQKHCGRRNPLRAAIPLLVPGCDPAVANLPVKRHEKCCPPENATGWCTRRCAQRHAALDYTAFTNMTGLEFELARVTPLGDSETR